MSNVCSKCGNDDYEKYYVKACVYGAIASGLRKALEEVVKHGSEPAAYIATKALEWRESYRGGVPIEDVMAFGEILNGNEYARGKADGMAEVMAGPLSEFVGMCHDAELAKVVAWLRAKAKDISPQRPSDTFASHYADALERGEHK